MLPYALRRLAGLVPLLFCITLTVFVLVRSVPGDPVTNWLGEKGTAAERDRIVAELGLDAPLHEQFWIYLKGLARGDLGTSYIKNERRVADDIARRFPATVELALLAMFLATCFGMAAGILSAVLRGRWLDYLAMFLALVGVSVPVFWLGLLLILLLGQNAPFPSGGRLDPAVYWDHVSTTGFHVLDAILTLDGALLVDALRHLALPAVALATIPMALISRMTRSALLERMGEDFVRTARAKGCPERRVVLRHALRASLVSIFTVLALQLGTLLAGAVLTETVFEWGGLGTYVVDAVNNRDYMQIQGGVLVIATAFVLANLLADLSYAIVDPRLRLR